MKTEYNLEADALYIKLRPAPVIRSEEIKEGIIVDYDREGYLIGIEILDAGKKIKPEDLAQLTD